MLRRPNGSGSSHQRRARQVEQGGMHQLPTISDPHHRGRTTTKRDSKASTLKLEQSPPLSPSYLFFEIVAAVTETCTPAHSQFQHLYPLLECGSTTPPCGRGILSLTQQAAQSGINPRTRHRRRKKQKSLRRSRCSCRDRMEPVKKTPAVHSPQIRVVKGGVRQTQGKSTGWGGRDAKSDSIDESDKPRSRFPLFMGRTLSDQNQFALATRQASQRAQLAPLADPTIATAVIDTCMQTRR